MHCIIRSFPTRRSSDLDDPVGVTPRRLYEPAALLGIVRHDSNSICLQPLENFGLRVGDRRFRAQILDRKSTRLNSSHRCISYAVFSLKKKNGADLIRAA